MCVFYRFGSDLVGGAEHLFLNLTQALAQLGNDIDVYTTGSLDLTTAWGGYLLWDNQVYCPLPENEGGVDVYRSRIKNLKAGDGKEIVEKLEERFEAELAKPWFAAAMARALSVGRGYLCHGWHEMEFWGDDMSPARWTEPDASFVFRGAGVDQLQLTLYSSRKVSGTIRIGKTLKQRFSLEAGVDTPLSIELPRLEKEACRITTRASGKTGDHRALGVAVRSIRVRDEQGIHEMDLRHGYERFLAVEREVDISALLWANALRRPRRYSRLQAAMIGPTSRKLSRRVRKRAGEYDVILANMIPMTTFTLGSKAARRARKPVILVPLFHPRDPNHYWRHFHEAMAAADMVECTSAPDAALLAAQGFKTEYVNPGFDLEEFASQEISGERFREKHGLGDDKVLLFVARKTAYKRYDLAMETVAELRSRGWHVRLVMIGPDEDQQPLFAEHVLYLGRQERTELLDAYDACDVFIMPSEAESFGMVFCEAWLRRKPVIGNRNCAAVASLIEDGVDGFLGSEVSEFADQAERLFREPELAAGMGMRGHAKVLETFSWPKVAERYQELLLQVVKGAGSE
ncbi:MAG: glycosyltransferase family 4 protein [Candidatus Geothermincolia bacterium]